MFRRVLGALTVAGALLVSWGAVSQPRASSGSLASARPTSLPMPVLRPGFAPAPAGAAGHFELRQHQAQALFSEKGMALHLPSRTQQVRELGWSVAGGRAVKPQAQKPREAKLHRLVGPREAWEQEVPTFGGLRYPGVLPGVDLWLEERAGGVEYGFRAERGADLRRVRLEYVGAREVRVVEEGRALEVDLGEGVLREEGLRCLQEEEGGLQREVGCRFTDVRPVGRERWEYAIAVEVKDPERPVVVDPLVLWDTYLGGTGLTNLLWDIEQDATGDVFIVGTYGGTPRFPPADGGSVGGLGGGTDVLVARFRPDGGLVWATQLGGAGTEDGKALFVGDAGEVYVAGSTTTPEFQWKLADGGTGTSSSVGGTGSQDGFLARLSPSGKQLDWFLRVGGTAKDEVHNMIRFVGNKAFVVGQTWSSDMPQIRSPTGVAIQGSEGFVSRIDLGLPQVDWTVLIQGAVDDAAYNAITDSSTVLYVVGTGEAHAMSGASPGTRDAFVVPIFPITTDGPSRKEIVRFGGNDGNDEARAVSLTSVGDVVVWGTTYATRFPDAGTVKGEADIFAAVYGSALGSGVSMPLRKAILIGGEGAEQLLAVETDESERIFVGGQTRSSGFPAPGGFDTSLDDGGVDGFVARVELDAKPPVLWGSFVGGSGTEQVLALRRDTQNESRLFIGGRTTSKDLDYASGGSTPNPTGEDMFLMSVDFNVEPDGGTTPGPGESDAGTEPGTDGGTDAGTKPGADGGTDAGTGGAVSPLGWSCGSSGSSGGMGALALGSLAGLALLASRRRRSA